MHFFRAYLNAIEVDLDPSLGGSKRIGVRPVNRSHMSQLSLLHELRRRLGVAGPIAFFSVDVEIEATIRVEAEKPFTHFAGNDVIFDGIQFDRGRHGEPVGE